MASPASPADPLAVLSGLYLDPTGPSPTPTGLLVRLASLEPLSAPEWRLEYSLDRGSSWSTPEPHKPGHPTPQLAIENGSPLISSLRNSRSNNDHVEISTFFSKGKLRREQREIKDESGSTSIVTVFSAEAEDGTWVEDSTPIEAIRKAKEHKPSKPVKPGQNQKRIE